MDIHWSAYREMFATNALTFTYTPQTLVRRIQFSEHIMSLWQQRFPDRIMTVRYEDVVLDIESVLVMHSVAYMFVSGSYSLVAFGSQHTRQ